MIAEFGRIQTERNPNSQLKVNIRRKGRIRSEGKITNWWITPTNCESQAISIVVDFRLKEWVNCGSAVVATPPIKVMNSTRKTFVSHP